MIDANPARLLQPSRWLLIATLAVAAASLVGHALGLHHSIPMLWLLRPHHLGSDSWAAMNFAFEPAIGGRGGEAYDVAFAHGTKFQYAPSSLLLVHAFHALGLSTAPPAMNAFTWFAPWLMPLSAFMAAPALARLYLPPGPEAARAGWRLAGSVAVMSLFFYPVIKAFEVGQVQTWLSALFCLAVVAFLYGRGTTCGWLIGLICLIKPQFLLFAIWALLRRRRDIAIGIAVPMVIGTALALVLYGVDMHLAYVKLLSQLSRTGESYAMNQSMNGLMNRLLQSGSFATFDPGAFPAYHPLVHAATMLSTLVLVGLALFMRPRDDARDRVLDLVMAALCFTMASPIAWEHHYGILPIVYLVMLFCAFGVDDASARRRLLVGLGVSALACSIFLPWLKRFNDPPVNLLQSTLYYGAVLCVVLLVAMRRRTIRLAPLP